MDRFEEGLQIITRLLRADEPVTFQGKTFQVHEAVLMPRPTRPRILVAGRGRKRSFPLAACFADDWNAMFLTPEALPEMNAELDRLLLAAGRKPADLRRTIMQAVEVGRTEAEVEAKCQARAWAWWREPGLFAGTKPKLRQRLDEFERAGAQRVMLQWLDLDDIDGLELLADAVL
jgi:alkanesulfonate monooxygenase SsuD/methylene tetrahydromethanopterin reductase-like flavin-dependent oxidoreductase (luciferase family)